MGVYCFYSAVNYLEGYDISCQKFGSEYRYECYSLGFSRLLHRKFANIAKLLYTGLMLYAYFVRCLIIDVVIMGRFKNKRRSEHCEQCPCKKDFYGALISHFFYLLIEKCIYIYASFFFGR